MRDYEKFKTIWLFTCSYYTTTMVFYDVQFVSTFSWYLVLSRIRWVKPCYSPVYLKSTYVGSFFKVYLLLTVDEFIEIWNVSSSFQLELARLLLPYSLSSLAFHYIVNVLRVMKEINDNNLDRNNVNTQHSLYPLR